MEDLPLHVKRAIEHAAAIMLADVPGAVIKDISSRYSQQPSTMGGRRAHLRSGKGATLTVTGWGPSLHEMDLDLPIKNLKSPGEEIAAFADAQRQRAARAGREGLGMPIRWNGNDMPASTMDVIGHMRTSRSALAALLRMEAGSHRHVADQIRRSVVHALRKSTDFGRWHGVSGRRVDLNFKVDGVRVYGRNITLPHYLPEAMVASLPGRRLCDVMGSAPEMEDQLIVSAENDEIAEGVRLRLQADNVRILDVLGSE